MKIKIKTRCLLIVLCALFSASCLFILFNKTFGLELRFEKREEKDNAGYKFRLPWIIASYVNRLYVEPERIKPVEMVKEALAWEERIIPEVLTDFDETTSIQTVTVDDISKTFDLSKINRPKDMVGIIQESLVFINQSRESNEDITPSDIEYAAINGMLTQLDPHSIILPPKEFNEFKIGTTGKFGGLGMVVSIRDGQLTVISPIEGTPAARAGIKTGDKIVEIDGESTVNMTLTESVGKLRGDPGTEVILSILASKSTQPKIITLKREIIAIPTVESASLGDGLGYVRIRNFQDDTSLALDEHLNRLRTSEGEIKGLIIDLRNNSGGLLDQAIEVADKFLESGAIVFTVGPGGHPREAQYARKTDVDEKHYPIVILVDAGSASGAEIVAGALKENNRAVLVGDRTFGKGSVQQLIELMDGSALKLTIAKYLTPLFTDIQSVGITPDIKVVPVTISKDDINLFRGPVVIREEDLKQHLEEHYKGEAPFATIKYFQETIEEDKTREPQDDPYKLPEFDKDFHIILGRKLLTNTTAWQRQKFLEESLHVIEDTARLEEEKITLELQKQGIDWSRGTSAGMVKSHVSYSLSPANGKVKAGESISVTLNITNDGEEPLYQLRGISSSENALFDKREFIFGKISPGESKSYCTTVEIPKNSLDREDEVVIKFEELNHQNPQDVKIKLVTKALPRPRFAYSYQVLDCRQADTPLSDCDGRVQVGEDIELLIFVKNVGEGPSEKAVVSLRNLSEKNVLVKKGRVEIGTLNPGDIKKVRLSLFVKEMVTTESFTVDVVISDLTFGTFLSDKLIFPVVPHKTKMVKAHCMLRIEKHHTPLYGGMSFDSPVIAIMDKGTVLKSDAKSDEWFRIVLPDKRYGWVSQKEAAVLTDIEKGPDALAPFIQHIPPSIVLTKTTPDILSTNDNILPLSVIVKDDEHVKHVYVLINNDKVFFKSNKFYTAQGRSQMVINTDIRLKKGSNVVTIVARDNHDLVTTKSFVATQPLNVAQGL